MQQLTKRQAEVLSFIEKYVEKHGFAPTFREIQKEFSIASVSSVAKHIKALQKRGLVTKSKKRSARNVLPRKERVTNPSTKLPLIGALSGVRVEIFQRGQEALFPPLEEKERAYAFLIKDRSFMKSQINEGDIIAVSAKNVLDEGEMALATYKGCPKIGPFREEGDSLFLGDEKFAKDELILLGALFFLIRSY